MWVVWGVCVWFVCLHCNWCGGESVFLFGCLLCLLIVHIPGFDVF